MFLWRDGTQNTPVAFVASNGMYISPEPECTSDCHTNKKYRFLTVETSQKNEECKFEVMPSPNKDDSVLIRAYSSQMYLRR